MNKRVIVSGILFVLPFSFSVATASIEKSWTNYPLINRIAPFSRGSAKLKTVNIKSDSLDVYASIKKGETPVEWKIKLENGVGQFRPRGGKQGAYHLVVAKQIIDDEVRIATAAVQFPNPAPPPRRMLATAKAELEIVPLKLPREHAHYRAGQSWDFLVREQGRAVPSMKVVFETTNGTRQELLTDQQGLIRVTFPDDFKPQTNKTGPHAGHQREAKAGFVLATQSKTASGKITSAFNYHYLPSDWKNKNLWLGSGFALLGMLAATPLVRGQKKKGAKR